MPEEQAFCLLVRMMHDYNLRQLYTPKMTGLQLRNFHFECLMEDQFPLVFQHLRNQDIQSSSYASQW